MTKRLFADYCGTTLSAGISASATTCGVVALTSVGPPAFSFPAYVSGDSFVATLIDAATQTVIEQVLVTSWNVSTNSILAMTRGVNGTTAAAYLAGDSFQLLFDADAPNHTVFLDQYTSQQTPVGTINGVNATFTFTQAPPSWGFTYVINGIIQQLSVDYTYALVGSTPTITKLSGGNASPIPSGTDQHWIMPYPY